MTSAELVFACVLKTVTVGYQTDHRCDTPYIREVSASISHWSAEYGVPVEYEVAKIYHESRFDQRARGAAGEIGLTQIKRGGAIQGRDLRLTRRQLEDVDTNILIGTKYLSQFVRECQYPVQWLTKYNRPARGCHASRYSRGVLRDLRYGRRVPLLREPEREYWLPSPVLVQEENPKRLSTSEKADCPDRTSCKEVGRSRARVTRIHELLPSGTCCLGDPTQTELKSEEWLAAPFAEP